MYNTGRHFQNLVMTRICLGLFRSIDISSPNLTELYIFLFNHIFNQWLRIRLIPLKLYICGFLVVVILNSNVETGYYHLLIICTKGKGTNVGSKPYNFVHISNASYNILLLLILLTLLILI